ncbi:hypothetical protein [Sorangium sp. So ce1078]|uniref:hypothetical protein n=1 Tax=Sorangium sp. So ce1078 TaxID=3133329 RepID=UPI003F622913
MRKLRDAGRFPTLLPSEPLVAPPLMISCCGSSSTFATLMEWVPSPTNGTATTPRCRSSSGRRLASTP